MFDYTWVAQPVATVFAALIALRAAKIAYQAATASVREQRRIANRRELSGSFDTLAKSLLELQINAGQYALHRPGAFASSSTPSQFYTDAIAREPALIRAVMFNAISARILGYADVFKSTENAVREYGHFGNCIKQAAFATNIADRQRLSDEADKIMVGAQQAMTEVFDLIQARLAASKAS